MRPRLIGSSRAILFGAAAFLVANFSSPGADLSGTVQGARQPIVGSTVTPFAASSDAPKQLAQGKTGDNGAFALTYGDAPADSVLATLMKNSN